MLGNGGICLAAIFHYAIDFPCLKKTYRIALITTGFNNEYKMLEIDYRFLKKYFLINFITY